jgi:hypothetical protein
LKTFTHSAIMEGAVLVPSISLDSHMFCIWHSLLGNLVCQKDSW